MGKTSIYVMTHKKFQQNLPDEYIVLQVGAALNKDLGYQKDNEGENISYKNPNYCELTGLYWVWKNSNADVVGLCHYRRYLSRMPFDKKLAYILTESEITKKLKHCDMILPYPVFSRITNKDSYCIHHKKQDYYLVRQAIEKVSPDYLNAFDQVMQERFCCQCNMFIAPKSVADRYCQWLFSVFDEVEKHVDMTGYDSYQARMYGFMSERLLNVWVKQNQIKKRYAFLATTDQNYAKALHNYVSDQLKKRTAENSDHCLKSNKIPHGKNKSVIK